MQPPAGKVREVVEQIVKTQLTKLVNGRDNVYVLQLEKVKNLIERKLGVLNVDILSEILAKTAYFIGAKYVIIPDHERLTIKCTGKVYLVKELDEKIIMLLLNFPTFVTYQVIVENGKIVLGSHHLSPKLIIEVIYGEKIAQAFNNIVNADLRRKVYKVLTIYHKELSKLVEELGLKNDTKLAKHFIKILQLYLQGKYNINIDELGEINPEITKKILNVLHNLLSSIV